MNRCWREQFRTQRARERVSSEGRNVAAEYRWTEPGGALELAAADLVNRRVTVIAANTALAALRAKTATERGT